MERLLNEIEILLRMARRFKIDPLPVITQLVDDILLPSVSEPPKPAWRVFKWPDSGIA